MANCTASFRPYIWWDSTPRYRSEYKLFGTRSPKLRTRACILKVTGERTERVLLMTSYPGARSAVWRCQPHRIARMVPESRSGLSDLLASPFLKSRPSYTDTIGRICTRTHVYAPEENTGERITARTRTCCVREERGSIIEKCEVEGLLRQDRFSKIEGNRNRRKWEKCFSGRYSCRCTVYSCVQFRAIYIDWNTMPRKIVL